MKPSPPIAELLTMLTYARPAGSPIERAFIDRYIAPLPNAVQDAHGNWYVCTDPDSTVLWSCHTDTVARRSGRSTVHHDHVAGFVYLSRASKGHYNCLGGDNTVGVWIMRSMILAAVPGHYVFHAAEECGGIGSSRLADARPDWLARCTMAIAFDRRGTGDVVTHQATGRTASDAFAVSLATWLESAGLSGYAPARGVFTDTANYDRIIAECTNLSAGTADEHHVTESVDLHHADRLRCAMLTWTADVASSLTVERDPTVYDYAYDRQNLADLVLAWDRMADRETSDVRYLADDDDDDTLWADCLGCGVPDYRTDLQHGLCLECRLESDDDADHVTVCMTCGTMFKGDDDTPCPSCEADVDAFLSRLDR